MLPGRPELPVPWLLGSSAQSAIWAGQLGLPYAFADFINAEGSEIAKLYRERFEPSRDLQAPRTAVAVWALAAPTDDEAIHLSTSSRMAFTLLHRNQLIPVPPPEKAVEFLKREGKPLNGGRPGRRSIVGSPEKVRAEVEAVAVEYGAEEVIVVTITYDHQARRRSYELIAEAFELESRRTAVLAYEPSARVAALTRSAGDRVAHATERDEPRHVEVRAELERDPRALTASAHPPGHVEALAVRCA